MGHAGRMLGRRALLGGRPRTTRASGATPTDSGTPCGRAASSVAVVAASRATRTIPIVAVDLETDPLASGLVTSLARPGGNVTGLFLDFPELAGKWLELMREAVPSRSRVARPTR